MNLEKSKQVVQCWYELNNHQNFTHNKDMQYRSPIFLIDPVMVNESGVKDDDDEKNIYLNYWYEVLVPNKLDINIDSHICHYGGEDKITNLEYSHDYTIDGGGGTYEDCIINMHKAFMNKYGTFEELF